MVYWRRRRLLIGPFASSATLILENVEKVLDQVDAVGDDEDGDYEAARQAC